MVVALIADGFRNYLRAGHRKHRATGAVTTIASRETNTFLAVKRSGNVSQLFGKRPKNVRQAIKEEKVVQLQN